MQERELDLTWVNTAPRMHTRFDRHASSSTKHSGSFRTLHITGACYPCTTSKHQQHFHTDHGLRLKRANFQRWQWQQQTVRQFLAPKRRFHSHCFAFRLFLRLIPSCLCTSCFSTTGSETGLARLTFGKRSAIPMPSCSITCFATPLVPES